MLSSMTYVTLESVLHDLLNVPAGPRGPGGPAKKVSRKRNRMEQITCSNQRLSQLNLTCF